MITKRQMPKYKCHKEVWALRIASVEVIDNPCEADDQTGVITPAEDGYAPFPVSKEYMVKHVPQADGYYVVYEDGYKSYSPPEPFESGYTRLVTRITDKDLLVIIYGGDSINTEFDKKAITLAKSLGYDWFDSGYDLIKNERDLRFKRT